jgi:hypothetical protein
MDYPIDELALDKVLSVILESIHSSMYTFFVMIVVQRDWMNIYRLISSLFFFKDNASVDMKLFFISTD